MKEHMSDEMINVIKRIDHETNHELVMDELITIYEERRLEVS